MAATSPALGRTGPDPPAHGRSVPDPPSDACPGPLTGYRVAVTDQEPHRLVELLRQRSVAVVETPLFRAVPAEKDARLRAATRRCLAGPVDHLIVGSAAGWRRWIVAATAWGLEPALLDALRAAAIVPLDPAIPAALRVAGLTDVWSADGGEPRPGLPGDAVEWLLAQNLDGRRVVVAADEPPAAAILSALRTRRATVVNVATLRWAPPAGLGPMYRLARMIIRREVHAVTFEGAAAGAAFVDVIARVGRRDSLLRAFATDVIAASVGPGSSRILGGPAIPMLWASTGRPDELAALLTKALLRRRREFRAGGRLVVVQGDTVAVDGSTASLPPVQAAIMRALADQPGRTLSRMTLAPLVAVRPGGGNRIDVAVSRLRTSLGRHAWLVATVAGCGYRLDLTSSRP